MKYWKTSVTLAGIKEMEDKITKLPIVVYDMTSKLPAILAQEKGVG